MARLARWAERQPYERQRAANNVALGGMPAESEALPPGHATDSEMPIIFEDTDRVHLVPNLSTMLERAGRSGLGNDLTPAYLTPGQGCGGQIQDGGDPPWRRDAPPKHVQRNPGDNDVWRGYDQVMLYSIRSLTAGDALPPGTATEDNGSKWPNALKLATSSALPIPPKKNSAIVVAVDRAWNTGLG